MKQVINESLAHLDMKDHVTPKLLIDEFKSKLGSDSDVITLTFIVDGKEVGRDLVVWFERGYEWVIDADISPGEVLDKKWYVFVEMDRRSSAPKRIIDMLADLKTLTDLKVDDWTIKIAGKRLPAAVEAIEDNLILNPIEYKKENEEELNEWRNIAGIKSKTTYHLDDDIVEWQRQAGIK